MTDVARALALAEQIAQTHGLQGRDKTSFDEHVADALVIAGEHGSCAEFDQDTPLEPAVDAALEEWLETFFARRQSP